LTNHHVGASALQKLSSPGRDLLSIGFHARTRAEEMKCVDMELNVLIDIHDVTARVSEAVKPGMDAAAAQVARRAIMNTIEQESFKESGLRSDVVTLYQGGEYHMYRYKKYTDVRLVFAPEHAIAFFGGDPDNFEFPRYDLDICFFRAYEKRCAGEGCGLSCLEQVRRERGGSDLRRRPSGAYRSTQYRRSSRISARPAVSGIAQQASPA